MIVTERDEIVKKNKGKKEEKKVDKRNLDIAMQII